MGVKGGGQFSNLSERSEKMYKLEFSFRQEKFKLVCLNRFKVCDTANSLNSGI